MLPSSIKPHQTLALALTEIWTCTKIVKIGTNQYVTLYMGILREVTAHTTVPLSGLFLGFLKTTHRTKLS